MYTWDFSAIIPYWPVILRGLWMTIQLTVVSVIGGLAIGLVVGVLRTNLGKWLDVPLRLYVELFRCTPLLVQLIWMYYALPVLIGVDMSALTACYLTLSLNAGAFYAEIFRGGIEAVDAGQTEAGKAIGMRRAMIFRRIVLPQAIQIMIPSFINQTLMQFKNTSLASVVAVADLLYQGTVVTAASYRPLEIYTAVAAIYFAVLFPITLLADRLEKKMGVTR